MDGNYKLNRHRRKRRRQMMCRFLIIMLFFCAMGAPITASAQEIKLLNSGDACDAGNEGALIYNNATNAFQSCGSDASWSTVLSSTNSLTGLSDVSSATATAGRLLVSNGSTWDSLDSLYVDPVSGNVGIGTTSPTRSLDLVGALNLQDTTSSIAGVIYKGANSFIHTYHGPGNGGDAPVGRNLFVGELSGNFTTGDTAADSYYASNNIGVGYNTLHAIRLGRHNVGIGSDALAALLDGNYNMAIGSGVLINITSGSHNSGIGYASLSYSNGSYNVAIGGQAGYYAASNNTFIGYAAGGGSTNGALANSTIIGYKAGTNLLTAGSNNILIGYQAGDALTTGANNILIGYDIDMPSVSSSSMLNIGNLIYATGLDGSGTTLSTGNVGIGSTSPTATLTINGTGEISGGSWTMQTATIDNGVLTLDADNIATYDAGPTFSSDNQIVTKKYVDDNIGGATSLTGLTDVASATATAGRLLVSNGSTFDSLDAPLFVDVPNGRVGIGTATPDYYFDLEVPNTNGIVARFASGGTPKFAIAASPGLSSQIGSLANLPLHIFTNSATGTSNFRMTFTNGGNVGIGTTAPSQLLQVAGTVEATGYNLNGVALSLTGLSDINSSTVTAGRLLVADGTNFQSVDTLYVSPDSGGNVGIGTASPDSLVHIVGTENDSALKLDATKNVRLYIDKGDAASKGGLVYKTAGVTKWITGTPDSDYGFTGDEYFIGLNEDGTNAKLLIDSSGNVGIGSTSPTATLTINGTGEISGGSWTMQTATVNNGVLTLDADNIAVYDAGPTFSSDNQIVTKKYVDDNIGGATSLTGLTDVATATATAGRLLVSNGSTWDSLDSLFVDPASGNVGVGTTTPDSKLAVLGTATQLSLYYDASNYFSSTIASDGRYTLAALGTDADMSIDFSGATDGDFSINTDDLFVDTSAGYVGIGTANPGNALTIKSSKSGSHNSVLVKNSDDNAIFSVYNSSGNHGWISIKNASTEEKIRLSSYSKSWISGGNLGIGTSTPAAQLDIAGDANLTGGAWTMQTATVNNGVLTLDADNIATYDAGPTFSSDNQIVTKKYVDDNIGGATSLTGLTDVSSATATAGRLLVSNGSTWDSLDSLYVDPVSGNVGVGTDSPTKALQINQSADNNAIKVFGYDDQSSVYGDFYISSGGTATFNASNALLFNSIAAQLNLSADTYIKLESAQQQIYDAGGDFTWRDQDDSDSVRMTLESDTGRLGIGTAAPSALLDVNGDGNVVGTWTMDTVTVNGVMTLDDADIAVYDDTPSFTPGSLEIPTVAYVDSAAGATTLTGLTDVSSATATAGRLLVADGAGFQSVDTIYVDPDGVNVGIGVASPTSRLHLPQEDDATTPTFSFGDGDSGFYESADDFLRISIGGNLRYTVRNDSIYTINGAGIVNETPSDINPVFAPRWTSDTDTGIGSAAADQLSLIAGGIEWLRLDNTGSQAFFPTGNVGIGTTAPAAKLDVAGDVRADGSWTMETVAVNGVMTLDADDIAVYDDTPSFTAGSLEIPTVAYVDSAAGATTLTGLTDVSTATATAGRLLVSDGTDFESMAVSGDASMDGAGALDISAITGNVQITGEADEVQLTITANATQSNTNPLLLLEASDGTDLISMHSDNPQNLFLGVDAGKVNNVSGVGNEGLYNTFIGSSAGKANTTGYDNFFLGKSAGYKTTTGYRNVFLGTNSGYNNTTGRDNVTIGYLAGYTLDTGYSNTFIGGDSGRYNTDGRQNAFIGRRAGNYNTTGNNNAFLGFEAGLGASGASDISGNALLGYRAGLGILTGADGNILIGYQAADNLTTGANNIIIGYNIDAPVADGDDQLVIANLIYGVGIGTIGTDVSTGNIGIGVSAPTAKLDIAGDANLTGGSWTMQTATIENGVLTLDADNIATYDAGPTFSSDNQIVTKKYVDDNIGGATSLTALTDVSSATATAGRLLVSNGSTFDSLDSLYVDPVSGNVGVGTTTPGTKMEIGSTTVDGGLNVSSSAGGLSMIGLYRDGTLHGRMELSSNDLNVTAITNDLVLGAPSGDDIQFLINNVEKMRVDSLGNVGIGTTAPEYKLDVRGHIKLGDTGVNAILDFNASTRAFLRLDGTTYLTFNNNNVGIGTTSPQSALNIGNTDYADISDGLTFGDGDTGFYEAASDDNINMVIAGVYRYNFTSGRIMSGSGGGFYLQQANKDIDNPIFTFNGDTDTGMAQGGGDELSLVTGGSARVFVSSTGNVGIGTTAPTAKLDIRNGDANLTGGSWTMQTATIENGVLTLDADNIAVYDAGPTFSSDNQIVTKKYVDDNIGGATSLTGLTDVSSATATAGRLLVSNGSTFDSLDSLYVDPVSGNVGVGTTAPNIKLTVSGGVGISSGYLFIDNTGVLTNSGGITQLRSGSNAVKLTVNGNNDAFYVTSSGNVGIGTTSPKSMLEVVNAAAGNAGQVDMLRIAAGDNDIHDVAGIAFSTKGTGSTRYVKSAIFHRQAADGDDGIGSLVFAVDANSDAADVVKEDEIMRINSSGNVGIGTTAPSAKLDVVGSAEVNGDMYTPRYALTDAATVNIDWSDSSVQSVVLGGNRTINLTNGQDGGRYTLIVKQDGTGSRTVTWGASVRWADATTPTLTTTADKTDYITFIYNGIDSKYDGVGERLNF
ncbi:beta strand repeat-containing protein [Candidatus Omnitrophota bacterium]